MESVRPLRFDDGSPVRAASGVARLGDGWLVAQDDATHAAWCTPTGVTRLRVLPPVEGLDVFGEAAGTKHLKPDLEAVCEVRIGADSGALLLGSGSQAARMRAALVVLEAAGPRAVVADLTPLYAVVAAALAVPSGELNLEGACAAGARLRWFQRGNLHAGVASGSVDLGLPALLDAITGAGDLDAVPVESPRSYDLGEVRGVGLAVTDAVALSGGRVLVTAAAEDTPNAVDDGPVVASALALLEDDRVLAVAPLPELDGEVHKVEGLAVLETLPDGLRALAVVDADDPGRASTELILRVRW